MVSNCLKWFSLGQSLEMAEYDSIYVAHIFSLDQQSGAIPCQELVVGNQWRELENMKAQFVAVNGIRKVACVVCCIYIWDPLYLVYEDFYLGCYCVNVLYFNISLLFQGSVSSDDSFLVFSYFSTTRGKPVNECNELFPTLTFLS